jgi:hypothetical protein
VPRIDVVIGNPPYTNGIYLKHLQRAYEVTQRVVVFLQPMNWLHSQKPGRTGLKARADALKTVIGNHFVKFDLMNGNKVFEIKYGQVCGITLIDKNKTTPEVTVHDYTVGVEKEFANSLQINPMYIDPEIFEPLKEKLWSYCKVANLEDLVNQPNGTFYVNLPLISGHVDETGKTDTFLKPDFFQLIYEQDKVVSLSPKQNKQNRWLAFPTREMAENCISYLSNSKLAKFCLMIVKGQQNLHRGELLWVPAFDFSNLCPDDMLYKKLALEPHEIEIIEQYAS